MSSGYWLIQEEFSLLDAELMKKALGERIATTLMMVLFAVLLGWLAERIACRSSLAGFLITSMLAICSAILLFIRVDHTVWIFYVLQFFYCRLTFKFGCWNHILNSMYATNLFWIFTVLVPLAFSFVSGLICRFSQEYLGLIAVFWHILEIGFAIYSFEGREK